MSLLSRLPRRRSSRTAVIPSGFNPNSIASLRQYLFNSQAPQGTKIFDERTGLGTDRPPQPGRACEFDGVDDYVSGPAIVDGNTNASFSIWFRIDSSSGAKAIANTSFSASNAFGVYLSGTTPVVDVVTTTRHTLVLPAVSLGDWHHLAATYDGTTIRTYLDGSAEATKGVTGAISCDATRIGANFFGSGQLAGRLFDFRLFDSTLTALEIEAVRTFQSSPATSLHWKLDDTNANTAYDSSGNGNDGTKTNTTAASFNYEGNDVPYSWQNEVGFTDDPTNGLIPRNESNTSQDVLGGSLEYTGKGPIPAKLVQSHCGDYDGANDYVASNNVSLNSTFTVVAIAAGNLSGTYLRIAETDFRTGFFLGCTNSGTNGIKFIVNNGTVPFGTCETTGLTNDQLYKIAATYDGTTGRLYIDDMTTASASDTFTAPGATNLPIYLGRQPAASAYWNGKISLVAVWNRVLSQSELSQAVDGDLPSSGLQVAYTHSEGVGTQLYDVSGNDNHGTATNITESSFWGTTQDVFSYNAAKGFSLYEHATADPLYVPYGNDGNPLVITPPTGYTLTEHRPAGTWHNLAESKIDFTGGVLIPGSSGWETAYAPIATRTNPLFRRRRTNGGNDYRADRFLIYDSTLSGQDLTDVQTYTQDQAD